MKDGVKVQLNLNCAKGDVNYYLKNGNEIWTHIDVKITFNGMYGGDYKVLTIQMDCNLLRYESCTYGLSQSMLVHLQTKQSTIPFVLQSHVQSVLE